jgi:hypothetical protein
MLRPSIALLAVTVHSLLPHDLVEETIGHMHDDAVALRACALVCRSWRLPSQKYLFHTVRLTNIIRAESLISLLLERPHIRPLIRDLHWNCPSPFGPRSIMGLFPRVQALERESWCLDRNLVGTFPDLRELDLWQLWDVEPSSSTLVESSDSNRLSDTVQRWDLRSLSFFTLGSEVLREVASQIDPKTVTTLRFCLSDMDMNELRSFIGSLTALEELRVEMERGIVHDGEFPFAHHKESS